MSMGLDITQEQFDEFLKIMQRRVVSISSTGNTGENWMEAFKIFDQDDSGYIEGPELRRIMVNVGEPVTLEDCMSVLREVDPIRDRAVACTTGRGAIAYPVRIPSSDIARHVRCDSRSAAAFSASTNENDHRPQLLNPAITQHARPFWNSRHGPPSTP